jgi:RNA polymerase sigma-70 factor (ECF subfamily)
VERAEPGNETTADAALLRAAREGDHAAVDRLLARHERGLFALCYDVLGGHADDAEDAVQETFLRALRALPGYRGDAAFRTWLFRIALNLCLRWKRRRRVTASWDDVSSLPAPCSDYRDGQGASPEATALRHLRVREALARLLPRHRAVLILKEREGWSVAEIAAGLRWTQRRVEYELSCARRALAEWRRAEALSPEDPDAGEKR